MDNPSTSSHPIPGPDDEAVSARLTAIEERLVEVIKRLDELKYLLAMLDHEQPNGLTTSEN